ncbi:bifunctional diaminohydroxyphosphoribosylaminopyrimidine deaminase/5-amino-6-(5-phosphoribosylamino)uracil reductase RibD [Hanamia caeni]|jgi:diaminohydroxyphosphoribosylaminopyrimidine deaminase/5-amino-6-(5-phosphoribosylamino)uracil reductase|uniref:Riboflavin biosynthesis protein RibD n=2 Tax=Hanamia caeni TaxID=2294116 RepID=A0A3M9NEB0_9BACT|nr:bifunctional diaminohydroxyphosphoribosylaminopyrimidine deaminase/5-amino-6-(5-phosphoribosylamino)uracil reductase RibD [Hanamia caeni]
MSRCIQLARLGVGNVAPNPMVGAVLVYEDKIIGEGYHQKFGEAHAEVNCINSVTHQDKNRIEKSTIYVSLEPCAHYGKTPPCSDLIIQTKIRKVVVGCQDIYKEVAGKGIEKLRNAGVEVVSGILENECKELNKRFFTFHQKQRPYIILKWAQSANGKIGSKDSERILISNDYSNRLVHKWRSEEAAILVGTNTVLKDDPSLTTRLWKGNNPIRIVIDKELKIAPSSKTFDEEAETLVFNLSKNSATKNTRFIKLDKENFIKELLDSLYKNEIQSVLIEGGAKTLQSFIDSGLWDEARIITNETMVVEEGINAPQMKNFTMIHREKYFSDSIAYFIRK